jgi:hypothetical protein
MIYGLAGDTTLKSARRPGTTMLGVREIEIRRSSLRGVYRKQPRNTFRAVASGNTHLGSADPLISKKRSMAVDRPRGIRCPCPIFDAEVEQNLPHTCNGGGGYNMSELRTHMTRGGKGRPPHLNFLKLCKICNNDFIDETVFNETHGVNCHFPHPQRKGGAADEYYQAFKAMVLKYNADGTKTSTRKYFLHRRKSS